MSVVEEIKQKLDIVEVVSGYGVPLKKVGRTFKACCPFHPEKTPSFIVNPDRQSWHCFGACATGGDVFAFVMRWEKEEFGQALRRLAERAGVTLPVRTQDQGRDEPAARLYQMNEAAALYYHHLLRNSPAGEEARRYLEGRAISPKATEEWQLGYSPPGWEDLSQYLGKKGYNIGEMVAAGLLVEREGGGGYDRFRHRLMFPIFDRQGRVTGFGARALDDSLPKYLNSPQTALFDKSRALYGIHRAQGAIRKEDQAVIVEGYMDALMAHQRGYENVIASLGTALTQGQVEQLKGLTKNLVLALDADAAGQEATLRGLAVAQETMDRRVVYAPARTGRRTAVVRAEEEYAEIRIAVAPVGKDPDEVLRENPALWERSLAGARPVMDYLFDVVSSRSDLREARGKRAAADSLLPLIAEIKSGPVREHYLQKLARLIQVDERTLQAEMKLEKRPSGKETQPVPKTEARPRAADCTEDYCLSLLLRHPELRALGQKLTPDFFSDTENRQVFEVWAKGASPDQVWETLDSSLRARFEALMAPAELDPKPGEESTAFQICRVRLEAAQLVERKRHLTTLAQEAQVAGDEGPDPERAAAMERELEAVEARLQALYRTPVPRGTGKGWLPVQRV